MFFPPPIRSSFLGDLKRRLCKLIPPASSPLHIWRVGTRMHTIYRHTYDLIRLVRASIEPRARKAEVWTESPRTELAYPSRNRAAYDYAPHATLINTSLPYHRRDGYRWTESLVFFVFFLPTITMTKRGFALHFYAITHRLWPFAGGTGPAHLKGCIFFPHRHTHTCTHIDT